MPVPSEHTFPWFPVALERPQLNVVWIGHEARYVEELKLVIVDDDYQGNLFTVASIEQFNDMEMAWHSTEDEPLRIRPVRPDDAERWDHPGSLRIPLPTEIIGAILMHTIPPPTIAAAVDDQGDVHTMILETAVGLYARYSGSWIRMHDISPIEQLDIVNVPASDLDAYDAADQAGRTVNIRYLNPQNQPYATAVETTPVTTPVAASGVPIIVASVADLPEAVEYVADNPDSKWYVERRWRALGGEATGVALPWLDEP